MRGADLLVQSLVQAGVSRIFSLSGNQIMPVYDACLTAGIDIIHTRHEAAAVYMAEAYAQLTGTIGVAMVTAGAGAANAAGPLFTASESETPVLLLTGDSPVAQDGMGAFQEMSQVAMLTPLTKLSIRPTHGADLGQAVARAVRTATSGRLGPVHIALGFDVVDQKADGAVLPTSGDFIRDVMPASATDIALIERHIAQAKRPIILTSPLLNATRCPDVLSLSERLGIPVIPMESPRGLRDPALGNIAQVIKDADLVVNLGKRVDFTLGFGKPQAIGNNAGWIIVNASIEERERARRNLGGAIIHTIAADPRDVVSALNTVAQPENNHTDWTEKVACELAKRNYPTVGGDQITSEQLCQAVQRQIDKYENAILVCDGGEFGQWAGAVNHAQSRIVNGISGAIGGGLCYGFAARLAKPDAPVFSLMGDGSAGFHFAEFETAARNNIPCVVVIGNDKRWNAEHQIQLREYGPDRLIGCELSDARYDLAAQALGGHGEYVTKIDDLAPALERAVASGKPACVNVIIHGTPAPSGAGH